MTIIKEKIKKKIFLIAEIGINHNGNVQIAKKIIYNAKIAGFDAVKFQKRNPDICVPEAKKKTLRQTPWGIISYLNYKKKIELNKKQYDEIDRYCKKIGIDWFASCWDLESLEFIKRYKPKFHKVASAMITNLNLLKAIAKDKKLTFISTGMSTFRDINLAIKIFKKAKCKFVIMHSVAKYPCPDNELNLNLIPVLKKKYRCPIGYSGHESTVTPSLIAATLGAESIERHVTLDRTMWGTDQASSLGFRGMQLLNEFIAIYGSSLGNGKKRISNSEKLKLKDQKYW